MVQGNNGSCWELYLVLCCLLLEDLRYCPECVVRDLDETFQQTGAKEPVQLVGRWVNTQTLASQDTDIHRVSNVRRSFWLSALRAPKPPHKPEITRPPWDKIILLS